MTPPTPPTPPTQTATARDGSAPDAPTAIGAALGRIPSGLFVATWREGDADRGMLASWVMQAGFAPPLITIAVAPGRGLMAAIAAGAPFVVNVLAENQRSLLARFGKPAEGEGPFVGLDIDRAACGAAKLGGAAAWLECRPVARLPAAEAALGDHVVVLAEVTAAGTGADVPPVVHVRKNGLRY